MMKFENEVTLQEIQKEIQKETMKAEALKEKMKNYNYSEKAKDEYVKLAENDILLNYKIKYLKENAIVVTGSYCLPLFQEIWNRYEGKSLGEKTREKIYNEFFEATGKRFKVYVHDNRDICFISMNTETGYKNFDFNYKDLVFYLPYDAGYRNTDNKIVKIDINQISQYHGIKCYRDAAKTAKEMIKTARKAKELAEKLNRMVSELNNLHPQKNDYIKQYNELNYIERL